jgi:cysteine desulfurase
MDHHATTPVDSRVLAAMLPVFTDVFGNAASTDHIYGAEAHRLVELAREQVAGGLGVKPEEVVLTSGATEANNLAIFGAAQRHVDRGRHVVTCVTEHKAVLDTCRRLEATGWEVTYLGVDEFGRVDPDDVRRAIRPDTVLVSIMAANNEIGTLAPLEEIGRITRERGVLFHTDATQAVGYVPVDIERAGIDLLSLSAHKFYGPKGIGALYVRRRAPRAKIDPMFYGGGHERGLRSGTLNVPGAVGLGTAVQIARREMTPTSQRLANMRDELWEALRGRIEGIHLNGSPTERLPHNLNVSIDRVQSRSLLVRLKHTVAISAGSACTTLHPEPSHVICALGFGDERAHTSVRFGLGRGNSPEQVAVVADAVVEAVQFLRRLAPVG